MELELIQKIDLGKKEHAGYLRLILLNSQTVVAFSSDDHLECHYLEWFSAEGYTSTRIDQFPFNVFDPPTLFQFQGYVGILSTSANLVLLFTEDEKTVPVSIMVADPLPLIEYPGFTKELSNYVYAGQTDSNIIPVLLKESGLLAVYFAELKIDVEQRTATWLTLNRWNHRQVISTENQVLKKPSKRPLTMLHALNKNQQLYVFCIGDKDAGYLKPGMDYSDLCLLDQDGKVSDTLFTMGQLNKNKGGKECLFTSSGTYAILSPVYKTDDWKGRQKLLDIQKKELIDLTLPKGLNCFKIIDHHDGVFLLIDGMRNLIHADLSSIVLCRTLENH